MKATALRGILDDVPHYRERTFVLAVTDGHPHRPIGLAPMASDGACLR